MLHLNQMYTYNAPKGMISERGVSEIQGYMGIQHLQDGDWKALNPNNARRLLPALPAGWDWTWVVTGRGEYVGTFPKRVGKWLYKENSLKAPATFLQELGNIARRHTEDNITYTYEFVNRFDWQAGDFGDRGSCYWGGHSGAREVMENEGGLAIRFYNDGKGFGRAWIAPIDENLYIVFNGYGFTHYPTLTIARVLAAHVGGSYKKIGLLNHGSSAGLLYINSDNGFIVGSPDAIAEYSEYDLQWGEGITCENCGDELYEDDMYHGVDGERYCEHCFYQEYTYCGRCGETTHNDDAHYIEYRSEDVCEYCYDRYYVRCEGCENSFLDGDCTDVNGVSYCNEDCLAEHTYECEHCESRLDNETPCDCQDSE